ncbi:hypothetical protein Ami103574_08025 [Aminipila butyrica]|uniref:TadE-like protein n=1 Tax=Aminipila butyrica TaxID=433296 RepID=A0A858BV49_9FIRM|nr:hypothetical protein [Aminipila butyrica]QIB69272.1 hypothetical protein Ami103574_08025 [Aminipila butyrica]
MGSKRGSAMVEAAMIYPLVIGTVMAVIYLMIAMYVGAAMKSNLDFQLRERAMVLAKTGTRLEESQFTPSDKYGRGAFGQQIAFGERKEGLMTVLHGQSSHGYRANALVAGPLFRQHQGEVYLIDEREYIRKVDMIKP